MYTMWSCIDDYVITYCIKYNIFFSYSYRTMSPSSVKLGIIFSQSWMSISRSLLFITLFFSFFFFFCLHHRLDLCACRHIHAHIKWTSKTWLSLCSYWRWGWWFSLFFFLTSFIYLFEVLVLPRIIDCWVLVLEVCVIIWRCSCTHICILWTSWLNLMGITYCMKGWWTRGLWSCGTCSHFPASTFLHQVHRATCDMIVQLAFVYVLSNLYLE